MNATHEASRLARPRRPLGARRGLPALADDTELFIGSNTELHARPNILFIIDNSGSMGTLVHDPGHLRARRRSIRGELRREPRLLALGHRRPAGLLTARTTGSACGAEVPGRHRRVRCRRAARRPHGALRPTPDDGALGTPQRQTRRESSSAKTTTASTATASTRRSSARNGQAGSPRAIGATRRTPSTLGPTPSRHDLHDLQRQLHELVERPAPSTRSAPGRS